MRRSLPPRSSGPLHRRPCCAPTGRPKCSMARRPPSELEQRWQEIFDNPLLTPETFRASGTSFSSNTCLRSVFWRVWLGRLPLPAARNRYSGSFSPAWRHYISTTRAEYDELAQKHLSNPESSPLLQQGESQDQAQLHTVQSDTHPLSLQADSPWQHYHASQELRVQIVKDVERTYPENDFFRNAQVQEIMTDLLLVSSSRISNGTPSS